MAHSCPRCGSLSPCDKAYCPLRSREFAIKTFSKNIVDGNFEGSSPTVFVGEYGYPKVNVGIMSPSYVADDSWLFDAPRYWGGNAFEIDRVISLRSQLINSRFTSDIRQSDKLLELSREIGMASKPVDVEVSLKENPKFNINFSSMMAPSGPSVSLNKAELTSNPHIDTRVDRIVSDTDFKAKDAMSELYSKGFDESFITKILSIGNLGVKSDRILVPTKWSITAVDDTVGKQIITEIKDYKESDCMAFFNGYLGNYYLVLFFSDVWSYELFEGRLNKNNSPINFSTDYEPYKGRTDYAQNCVGGYYAARLPIIEKLKEIKRQASVLVVRLISDEYYCPLGVWVVRESVRKTINTKPIIFSDKDLMLGYAKKLIKKRFSYDLSYVLDKSTLIEHIKKQAKLSAYL